MLLRKVFLYLTFLFCVYAVPVEAYVPILVEQESLFTISTIADPTTAQTFYGQMTGFPHTFEIKSTEPFLLSAKILLPDIDSSTNNISGIIIKEPAPNSRVIEVGGLEAKTATWETMYQHADGDTYRVGPALEKEVGPGTYRIEVHTPDNTEKYVLVVGTEEEMSIGYFELLTRLVEVKRFFEKSSFRIIESPYVYVPLSVMLVTGVGVYWVLRRRRSVVY